ncbi:response regulator transcription factor [Thiohalocapsa marina]|uniref:Response regulator transcription factor n=1 Tax=Thiohalocapsa marina TaxID=424902 RepID=A0A5M8FNI2_9GAMM|nr:response regulator transcription factor [Thiohalocapsa marina]KAA6186357.1 response regulator transcription factor [Thiohalocapsa marina]
MRLLLVEDDHALAQGLKERLRLEGFAVDWAEDGIDGGFLGGDIAYDAIILDLGLPGRPGLEVLQTWRSTGVDTPVLVLTARDAWHERVDGLKAGADDYLGKPFHVEELLARLQALLRRTTGHSSTTLTLAGLMLDQDRHCVCLPDQREIGLTGMEFRLLRYFMHHPDKVLSKERLLTHLYDQHAEHGSNLIEVYVRRLREKIGSAHVVTQRGQGYVFPSNP